MNHFLPRPPKNRDLTELHSQYKRFAKDAPLFTVPTVTVTVNCGGKRCHVNA